MADRQFIATAGIVQQFPDKEVVSERELNDQDIREFTIKTVTKQALVRVTLGPEFENVEVGKGDFVTVDGSFTSTESKGKTYNNIWARELTVTAAASKVGDAPVKKGKASTKAAEANDEDAPF